MIRLRKYQQECLDEIKKLKSQGNRRQLVNLPTGSGKTIIFSHLIRQMNLKCLVIAHTCELLDQSKNKIEMICPDLSVGIVNADLKEFDNQVVVSSIQSASRDRNLEELAKREFDVLIYDECHHAAASTSRQVLDSLGFGKGTNKLLIGFTATAFRSDARGLGEVFESVAYQKGIKEMIEERYLCPPIGKKIATNLDLSKVQTRDGDFQGSSLSRVMDTPEINDLIAQTYSKEGQGRKTICFCTNIQHSHNMSHYFRKHGINSEAISGNTSKPERKRILDEYQQGKIEVLCNCAVLCEGYDEPATDCIIIGRPTQSQNLYYQMIGRGMRLFPNKENCLVLDFSDKNHSLVDLAVLLNDAESVDHEQKEPQKNKKKIIDDLPKNLNKNLKSAIVNYDFFSDSFHWQKDGNIYSLNGSGNVCLEIVPESEDRYKVIYSDIFEEKTIASGIDFSYAFSAAEDFANEQKNLFIVSDLNAEWRNQPISEKQLCFFRKRGYRAGISNLTKGQASFLIGSGIFNKKGKATRRWVA